MIWEAQSRYVLGYFVLMLPLAAAGLADILDNVRKKKEKKNWHRLPDDGGYI